MIWQPLLSKEFKTLIIKIINISKNIIFFQKYLFWNDFKPCVNKNSVKTQYKQLYLKVILILYIKENVLFLQRFWESSDLSM